MRELICMLLLFFFMVVVYAFASDSKCYVVSFIFVALKQIELFSLTTSTNRLSTHS